MKLILKISKVSLWNYITDNLKKLNFHMKRKGVILKREIR